MTSAAACREAAPEITAVRIIAEYPAGVAFDQLRFALKRGAADLFPAALRPETARQPLPSPQDFVVYLDDDLAEGGPIVCEVDGVRASKTIRSGGMPVEVVRKRTVPCRVVLGERDSGVDGPDDADADSGRDVADERPGDAAAGDPGQDVRPDEPSPPDAPIAAAGCADGMRTGFLDRTAFPDIASCGQAAGATMSYEEAVTAAATLCQKGWHWCRATEVGRLPPSPQPGRVTGGTCSWLDSGGAICADVIDAYSQIDCAGGVAQSATTAGPPSGGCGLLPSCTNAWKLVVALERWGRVSVKDAEVCQNHVAFQCAGGLGATDCWLTCCRD